MIGSTIGHYTIEEKLGEGGMGVVYKATDTKLDRTVALKFLPEQVSANFADLERFVQEARAAAGLSHPNICTIHGIEESEGKNFIVMEFVDGQTLQEKKSSLSMKQAVNIGIQIAEGLAAAHEKGIVHRDIKPENIMIRRDGRVQIMDFGLAKLRGASRLTKEGSTVGTAGYMSPEQLQGEEVDHRSDIFSLGVLLYEMITGQPPFKGVHESAIAYEVVNVESPPPSTIKQEISPELDAVVLECLEKDPNERAQSAKQIAVDLNKIKRASGQTRPREMQATDLPRSGSTHAPGVNRRIDMVLRSPVWVVFSSALLLVLVWLLTNPSGDAQTVDHLIINAITAPDQLLYRSDRPCMDISPDGRSIVFTLVERGGTQIYKRSLDSYEITPVTGTTNGTAPFFSPDGEWIGFLADGKIKKVPVYGGTAETICDAPGFRGATWGQDDRIYYSPQLASGLFSVPSSGGDPRPFSIVDSGSGERTHRWPQALPDGKWILYTVGDQRDPNSYVDAKLMIQSVETSERHELPFRGEMARYLEPGYLVVGRSGSLLATRFSTDDPEEATPLTSEVQGVTGDIGSGIVDFAVSPAGHLVYMPGTLDKDMELVTVSRSGDVTPLPLSPQIFAAPRISPDGNKLAYAIGAQQAIWVFDFNKNSSTRLTFSGQENSPLWSADGTDLFFAQTVPIGIRVQPADGSAQSTKVITNTDPVFPTAVTRDGKQLIVSTLGASRIYITDIGPEAVLKPLIRNGFSGSLSPDSRFIVYGSLETGTLEVFVQTFPDLKGKWQISIGGGFNAMWSKSGTEIFYISMIGKMMTVPIRTTPGFAPGHPRELFDVSQMSFPNSPVNNYDVSRDGERFIMVRNKTSTVRASEFRYVRNWVRELKQIEEQ